MKRLTALLAAVALLAGCAWEPPPPTEATTLPTSEPTQVSVPVTTLYRPDSYTESQTAGAVREYALERQDCLGVAAMGEDLIVFYPSGSGTTMSLLTGEEGAVGLSVLLDCPLDPNSQSVQVNSQGIGYYDSVSHSVVLLDEQFREIFREDLPETVTAPPIIGAGLDVAFYCDGAEIRALNMSTGIARLVSIQSTEDLTLVESLFDDTILVCQVRESDSEFYTDFLSVETGESLGTDETLLRLAGWEDWYLYQRMEGKRQETFFGRKDEAPLCLNLDSKEEQVYPAPGRDALVGVSPQGGVSMLWLYDLTTGRRTAGASVEGLTGIQGFVSGTEGLWFLAEDQQGHKNLYLWNPQLSQIEGQTVYTGPRYTALAPDTAGLNACRQRAEEISQAYGVDIRLGVEGLEPSAGQVTPEFQVPLFQESLDALEKVLARFPEGFFSAISRDTESGVLHICLVRSVSGPCSGLQYWAQGDACIALAVGGGEEEAFCHCLSHALDTFIVSNSLAYDQWESLNPEGVQYFYSYEEEPEEETAAWTEGAERAFLSPFAMSYPKEDRAEIFTAALLGSSEDLSSPILQEKLSQICQGLRDACGYPKNQELPWEQFLLPAQK